MGQLRHDLVRLEPGGELTRDHRVRFWLEADLRRGRRNERFLSRPDMATSANDAKRTCDERRTLALNHWAYES